MERLGKKELFVLGTLAGLLLAAAGMFWMSGIGGRNQTTPIVAEASMSLSIPAMSSSAAGSTAPSVASELYATAEPDEEQLVIYVVGAVQKPGIYRLDAGSRLADAVESAGGFSADADQEAVNLAMPLKDGLRYKLPRQGESLEASEAAAALEPADGKININTADATALQQLPGIGPSRAAAIIDYRTRKGPFAKIEDIKKVSGIGESIFSQLSERIVV